MSLRRVWAVARKEFLHVLRDARSLIAAIAIPMLLLLLFGYALTLDVDRVPLAIWDQSGTPASRDLIQRFTGSRYFSARAYVSGYAEAERLMDRSEVLCALVVPADFAQRVAAGRGASVQLIADGSDSNTAQIALGYAEAVMQGHWQDLALRIQDRRGAPAAATPLDVRPRVWFNPDLESRHFIVPGLIAVIMMIISALLTSLTVAREWERGTMEQLISTPVKGWELALGKLVPYFVIGMADVLIAVIMGEFLFGVPLRGSGALLFATAAVFLAGALGLGLLISILMRNQLAACQLALMATLLPAWLLSGFIFPISNMPAPIQALTHIIPSRYFVTLLRGIYLKGVGLELLWAEAALLAAFGAVVLAVSVIALKKRLA